MINETCLREAIETGEILEIATKNGKVYEGKIDKTGSVYNPTTIKIVLSSDMTTGLAYKEIISWVDIEEISGIRVDIPY